MAAFTKSSQKLKSYKNSWALKLILLNVIVNKKYQIRYYIANDVSEKKYFISVFNEEYFKEAIIALKYNSFNFNQRNNSRSHTDIYDSAIHKWIVKY